MGANRSKDVALVLGDAIGGQMHQGKAANGDERSDAKLYEPATRRGSPACVSVSDTDSQQGKECGHHDCDPTLLLSGSEAIHASGGDYRYSTSIRHIVVSDRSML